jgi:hypothetical protein
VRDANLYTLSRASELHFIFAAFFDAQPLVFIRLGHAAQPYRAVRSIARMAPWPLADAVISHIGPHALAARFERLMFHRLRQHRLHGDWFCFDDADGHEFAAVARLTYAEMTGRRLRWHPMPLLAAPELPNQALTHRKTRS